MQITQIWTYHLGLIVSLPGHVESYVNLAGSYGPIPAEA